MISSLMEAPAGTDELLEIVDEAVALLDEERDVFLQGNYDLIEAVSARKLDVLERLELAMAGMSRSVMAIGAIRRLIAASRRNEQIIEAARQGLVHARRKIGAIEQAVRGVVAYAEDGSRIASRADLLSNGKTF